MKTRFECNWMCYSLGDEVVSIQTSIYNSREGDFFSQPISIFVERFGKYFDIEEQIYHLCVDRKGTPIDYVLLKERYYA